MQILLRIFSSSASALENTINPTFQSNRTTYQASHLFTRLVPHRSRLADTKLYLVQVLYFVPSIPTT